MARTAVRKRAGFTIIEVLVTLVIISILASAAVPMAELAIKRSREQELRQALREIRESLDAHKQAWDDGKILKKAGESGYPRSLDVLTDGVADKTTNGAKIRFIRRIPRDPLSRDTSIPASKMWGKRSYASTYDDPREGDDVYDVYSLVEGSGLNGVPYREW